MGLKQTIATNKWAQRLGGKAYDITLPRTGYTVLGRESLRAGDGVGPDIYASGTDDRLSLADCQNSDPPAYHRDAPSSVEFSRPFVAGLRNARVVGEDAIVLTAGKKLVLESLYNGDQTVSNPGGKLSILKNIFSDVAARGGEGTNEDDTEIYCPLVNNWSHGYFHWMVDCLPKIEQLQYYEKVTGHKPTVLVSSDPPQWKVDSLEAVGYSRSDWEEWESGCRTFDRVVVPSLPRLGDFVAPRSIRWLADTVRSNLNLSTGAGGERIYVSRKRCSSRYVVNEEELLKELDEYGFDSYVLEDLSFHEQVDLFSGAEIVVGPHGAGFTNMIFADDLTLLELFGSDQLSHSLCYYGTASARGFNYAALRAPQQGNGLHPNIDAVSSLLKELL
jgi:hypothetical protein